jgi:hypothetical protein
MFIAFIGNKYIELNIYHHTLYFSNNEHLYIHLRELLGENADPD